MNAPDSEPDIERLQGSTFRLGPSKAPYWKFKLAQVTFRVLRFSRLSPFLLRMPLATRLAMWAFQVAVLSRDCWEVDDGNR